MLPTAYVYSIKSDPCFIAWQVNFVRICEKVASTAWLILLERSNWGMPLHAGTKPLRGQDLLTWAEHTIKREAEIKSSINAALTTARYLEEVCAAYNSAFDSDPQLKRLGTFQGMLTDGHSTLHGCVTEALLGAKLDVDMLATSLMEQLLYSSDTDGIIVDTFCRRVCRCITKHVMKCVKLRPMLIPDSFQLTEDDRTAETRADLVQKLENLDQAALRIRDIGREFVADNYEDKVLQSLLNAAEALNLNPASATQAFPPQPAHISPAAAALYDEVDLHSSGSPASGPSAQTQAEQEGIPGSPVASDFSFIERLLILLGQSSLRCAVQKLFVWQHHVAGACQTVQFVQ